ncbi:hypothetical protein A2U01_0075419, partial [Trifolium medium]|nr:hypothetical protein [Trifolium medium]
MRRRRKCKLKDSLEDKASPVDILKEHVAFLLQMQNSRENQ